MNNINELVVSIMPDEIDYMVYEAVKDIRRNLNAARERLFLPKRQYTDPIIGLPSIHPSLYKIESR
jgi:hypothetical protein